MENDLENGYKKRGLTDTEKEIEREILREYNILNRTMEPCGHIGDITPVSAFILCTLYLGASKIDF